jgi:hypothetical protein
VDVTHNTGEAVMTERGRTQLSGVRKSCATCDEYATATSSPASKPIESKVLRHNGAEIGNAANATAVTEMLIKVPCDAQCESSALKT